MKRLERSNYGMIGGVCQGIANYTNIDPTIVRVISVALLISGIGFVSYLVMWAVMPLGID